MDSAPAQLLWGREKDRLEPEALLADIVKDSEQASWMFVLHQLFRHVGHVSCSLNLRQVCAWLSNGAAMGAVVPSRASTARRKACRRPAQDAMLASQATSRYEFTLRGCLHPMASCAVGAASWKQRRSRKQALGCAHTTCVGSWLTDTAVKC